MYDGPMDKPDEQLIDAILAIVDQAERRAARRRQAASWLAGRDSGSHHRLYWLAVSDLGAKEGCVECECPTTGYRLSVPTFVEKMVTAEPGADDLKIDGDEDIYESFGYVSFADEMRLRNAFGRLVTEAQQDLKQRDAVFQYVEIEVWLCDPPDLGGLVANGMADRLYAVQLRPGDSTEADATKFV